MEYRAWQRRWATDLVNLVLAFTYHFCLTLPESFTQPGALLLAKPWTISQAVQVHMDVNLPPISFVDELAVGHVSH